MWVHNCTIWHMLSSYCACVILCFVSVTHWDHLLPKQERLKLFLVLLLSFLFSCFCLLSIKGRAVWNKAAYFPSLIGSICQSRNYLNFLRSCIITVYIFCVCVSWKSFLKCLAAYLHHGRSVLQLEIAVWEKVLAYIIQPLLKQLSIFP